VKSKSHTNGHDDQIQQGKGHKIFPLQLQDLINTKARECPLDPHEQPYDKECLAKEPYKPWDIIHHGIKTTDTYI
jgi:hypothetical protein